MMIACQVNAGEAPLLPAAKLQCETLDTPRAIENLHPHFMEGEAVDARRKKTGWDKPGCDDSEWKSVDILTGKKWNLVAQQDEPIGVVQE